MKMKTFSAVLRFERNPQHEVPLSCVTREEIKLLTFIHGPNAIPRQSLRYLGEREMVMDVRDHDGVKTPVTVKSLTDEYHRLAAKYDSIINAGRGVKYVEDCFKVTLQMDNIMRDVDAVAEIEAAMLEAEKSGALEAIKEGAALRPQPEPTEAAPATPAIPPAIGARFAQTVSGPAAEQ